MKKIYILLAPMCFACALSAQTLAPTVIAASGAYSTIPGGSISYTVGEMTMVQTFTAGSNILTQGFQQPDNGISAILDMSNDDYGSFVVYPNPAVDASWFAFQFPQQGEVNVEMYNALGQKVANVFRSSYTSGKHIEQLNSSNLASGMYLLTLNFVSSTDGAEHTMTKKLQVIR